MLGFDSLFNKTKLNFLKLRKKKKNKGVSCEIITGHGEK